MGDAVSYAVAPSPGDFAIKHTAGSPASLFQARITLRPLHLQPPPPHQSRVTANFAMTLSRLTQMAPCRLLYDMSGTHTRTFSRLTKLKRTTVAVRTLAKWTLKRQRNPKEEIRRCGCAKYSCCKPLLVDLLPVVQVACRPHRTTTPHYCRLAAQPCTDIWMPPLYAKASLHHALKSQLPNATRKKDNILSQRGNFGVWCFQNIRRTMGS